MKVVSDWTNTYATPALGSGLRFVAHDSGGAAFTVLATGLHPEASAGRCVLILAWTS